MIPTQETFYIRSGEFNLLCTFQPSNGEARFALLLVHPFGEEKKSAHRAFVETARALARLHVATFRFDMRGCGDSEGDFARVRLDDWLEDVAAAWDTFRERLPDVPAGLLGLRLGASLASRACRRLDDVRALVLWQPIVEGRSELLADLRRLFIQEMMTHGRSRGRREDIIARLERGGDAVTLDGYPLTSEMYRDIRGVTLAEERSRWPPATGLVQFARSTNRLEAFAGEAGIPCRVVAVPPVWIRSDFIPGRATGTLLAEEAVIPFLDAA